MPCISGTYDANVGILLQVGLLPGGTFEVVHQQAMDADQARSRLAGAGAQALVDTGASQTSISPRLAAHLALRPRGKVTIQGATGSIPVNAYYVDLMLSFGAQSLVVGNLNVCEFDPGRAPFQVLIGRDIICQGVLTMDFSGRFTFSI